MRFRAAETGTSLAIRIANAAIPSCTSLTSPKPIRLKYGVALTTARAVAHLREAGHRVQLLRPRQPGEAALHSADEWRTHGGPIPMYSDLRYGLARPRRLQRAWSPRGAGADADADADASAFVPDLVHVATPGPLAWAALRAARALRKPTSADFRTNFHAYSRHYGLG